jgi:hypothetical protein
VAYDQATALLAGRPVLRFRDSANDPTLTVSAVQRLRMIALLAQAAGRTAWPAGDRLASGARR